MRGTYKIYEQGQLIGEYSNILTDKAIPAILRFLAGETRSWAGSIAVGALGTAPSVTDDRLRFEIGRGTVNVRAANIEDDSIVVKATIPFDTVGVIYELGVFASPKIAPRDSDQALLTDFDTDVLSTTGVTAGQLRIGRVSSIIQGGTPARFTNLGFDISAVAPGDRFILAYESTDISLVEIRFKNDATSYVSYSFIPVTAGYTVQEWGLPDFTSTNGGTTQEVFGEIEVITSGAGELELDGLRVDGANADDDHQLISRATLADPVIKTNTSEMDIEYSISLDF